MVQVNPSHATGDSNLSGVLRELEIIAEELRSQSVPQASTLEAIRDLSQYEDMLKALDSLTDAGLVRHGHERATDAVDHGGRRR
ncbi:hypothetical protein [Nocardia sp. NPDC051832]|uniref:hypothetical protein n=1 Tax=Nocardia sp. NPDC051832 TaxID=3155673 RepID=UPI003437A71F